MIEQIKPETVKRMIILVRWFASDEGGGQLIGAYEQWKEARAIVAELPAPVDPDLLMAREVALRHSCPAVYDNSTRYQTNAGKNDNTNYMRAILGAIKRVRFETARSAEDADLAKSIMSINPDKANG